MDKKHQMVEIWGDVISIKDLLISIFISSASTMGGYFLAPSGDKIRELFYGLLGALGGLIITAILIKPKRLISFKEEIKDERS